MDYYNEIKSKLINNETYKKVTLYQDKKGAYYLRVEQYHDFLSADDVWHITRKEAERWIRKNVRNIWVAHKRSIKLVKAG